MTEKRYRAVVYGENDFWKFSRLYENCTLALMAGKRIAKENKLESVEIIITETKPRRAG